MAFLKDYFLLIGFNKHWILYETPTYLQNTLYTPVKKNPMRSYCRLSFFGIMLYRVLSYHFSNCRSTTLIPHKLITLIVSLQIYDINNPLALWMFGQITWPVRPPLPPPYRYILLIGLVQLMLSPFIRSHIARPPRRRVAIGRAHGIFWVNAHEHENRIKCRAFPFWLCYFNFYASFYSQTGSLAINIVYAVALQLIKYLRGLHPNR